MMKKSNFYRDERAREYTLRERTYEFFRKRKGKKRWTVLWMIIRRYI